MLPPLVLALISVLCLSSSPNRKMATPTAVASNIFTDALQKIDSSFPIPTAGYKARLILQFALVGLLALTSGVALVLHITFYRRIEGSRRVVIFTLDRSEQDKDSPGQARLMLSPIFYVDIMTILVAVGIGLSKWRSWLIFIQNKPAKDYFLASYGPWLGVIVQVWLASFSHLQTAFTARRRLGRASGVGVERPSIHNALLVGFPVVVLAIMLPVLILGNRVLNHLIDDLDSLRNLIMMAADAVAKGGSLKVADLTELARLVPVVEDERVHLIRYVQVVAAMSIVLTVIFLGMNVNNFILVRLLRQQVAVNRRRRSHGGNVLPELVSSGLQGSKQDDVTIKLDVLSDDPESKKVDSPRRGSLLPSPNPPRAGPPLQSPGAESTTRSFLPMNKRRPLQSLAKTPAQSHQEIALERLYGNLLWGIPVVIATGCLAVADSIVIIITGYNTSSWPLSEFCNDAITYAYATTLEFLLLVFIRHAIQGLRRPVVERWSSPEGSGSGSSGGETVTGTLTFDRNVGSAEEIRPAGLDSYRLQ